MADKTVIVLKPASLAWLEERGAEGRLGKKANNYANLLEVYLGHFRALVSASRPDLSDAAVAAIVDLLDRPHALTPYELRTLPEYLTHLPRFTQVALDHGLEPEELRQTLDRLTHVGSLWLFDQALLQRAAQQREELATAPVRR